MLDFIPAASDVGGGDSAPFLGGGRLDFSDGRYFELEVISRFETCGDADFDFLSVGQSDAKESIRRGALGNGCLKAGHRGSGECGRLPVGMVW